MMEHLLKKKNNMRLKLIFTLLAGFVASCITAQNTLIVLTEKGSLFTLYVNDKQVNDSAQSVVEAGPLYDDSCGLKMIFADKNLSTFGTTVFLTVGGKTVKNCEFTYSLAEINGKRHFKFVSVIHVGSDSVKKTSTPEARIKKAFDDVRKAELEKNRLAENYPPPANCPQTISDSLLSLSTKKLRDNHIEINRLKDAKWFISNNCISTKQMIKMMDAFDRQDKKLEIAEFSFPYLQDHRNFLEAKEALKFPSDQEQLEKFYHKHIEK
jgi:predicted HAD superfamily Cof-like phosphohydrolase